MPDDCIFCKIIAGQADADIVFRDDQITAFWDYRPAAPVHILVVPNKHIDSVNEADPQDAELLGKLILKARDLAKEQGVDERGYRLVLNVGRMAGRPSFISTCISLPGAACPCFANNNETFLPAHAPASADIDGDNRGCVRPIKVLRPLRAFNVLRSRLNFLSVRNWLPILRSSLTANWSTARLSRILDCGILSRNIFGNGCLPRRSGWA
jgi:histidine triad (HIT) family protein